MYVIFSLTLLIIYTLSALLRSSIHSLRIRMTSYPCNKYEQITPSYLLSVKYIYIYIFYFLTKTLIIATSSRWRLLSSTL